MRTTLDLDDDVLQAVKELAELRGTTSGKVLSDLARKALKPAPARAGVRNGVPLMPPQKAGSPIMTIALVNELLDEP